LGRSLRHPRPNDFAFDVAVLNLVCFVLLTRRANQVHIDTVASLVEPAPETAAGFFVSTLSAGAVFNLSKLFRQIFRNLLIVRKRFDMSGKSPA
jgi:hypothetical protein